MPPYAVPADLREALAPDGDATQATAAGLSDDQLSDAIADAQAEVDARVPEAPFTTVPALIGTITVDVAAFLATLTHRKGNPLPDAHPVALRYGRAEMLLKAAARGELDLLGAPDQPIGEASVVNLYEGSLFGLEDAGLGPSLYPPWVR